MKCPRCGSLDITVTTIGGIGLQDPTRDPNRATCESCKHKGNAGDWNAIEMDRIDAARWRALRPFLFIHEEFGAEWLDIKHIPLVECGEPEDVVDKLVQIAQERKP